MASSKKFGGRRKVQMVRMEKDSNRRVTFSKRCSGAFKKANEICTLCGVEGAIIVFSPGKKAFCFGHPSVEMIIERFSSLTSSSSSKKVSISEPSTSTEAQVNEIVVGLNKELIIINNMLAMEKKRGEAINEVKKAREQYHWWVRDIDDLCLEQLVYLEPFLVELRKNVIEQGNLLMMLETNK